MKYNRSICSTCKYMMDCVLTTNKSKISSCSEYMHIFDKENEIIIPKEVQTPKINKILKRRRPVRVSF